MHGFDVKDDGSNIANIGKYINKETFEKGVESLYESGLDILGHDEYKTPAQLGMGEILEKFDAVELRRDMASRISSISTDFHERIERDSRDASDAGSSVGNDIGEHTRQCFEFSRFDKSSSRVKFFFSTIADCELKPLTEKGKLVYKDGQVQYKVINKLNKYGLPQYVPVNIAYNMILNLCHDCENVQQLLDTLRNASMSNGLFYVAYTKLKALKQKVDKGDADAEALFVQLVSNIRSNKYNFDIVRSQYNKELAKSEAPFGLYKLTLTPSGTEYSAREYSLQWSAQLANGGTDLVSIDQYGRRILNPRNSNAGTMFTSIADMIDSNKQVTLKNGQVANIVGLKQWVAWRASWPHTGRPKGEVYLFPVRQYNAKKSKETGKPVYEIKYLDSPGRKDDFDMALDRLVSGLNAVGINITRPVFDWILFNKYGSVNYKALNQMLSSTNIEDSPTSFLQFLRDISKNGKLNVDDNMAYSLRGSGKVRLETIYDRFAFTKNLATWVYNYRHNSDQLTVLGTGKNKFYLMSNNNYMSDVVHDLNMRNSDFVELTDGRDPFIYRKLEDDAFGGKHFIGSYVLDQLANNPNLRIGLHNFIGFRTDNKDDIGSDYFDISHTEDCISKLCILESGGIIMPTLSDKKSWTFVSGIKLPGIDYLKMYAPNGTILSVPEIAESIGMIDGNIMQQEDVIDLFMSYAYSEYQSVKDAEKALDQMNEDGTKSTAVVNYYTKEQGARFSSLLGVWEFDNNGDEVFVSFNDKKDGHTYKDNIKTAEEHFFSKPISEQRRLIARNLDHNTRDEIQNLADLGLIDVIGFDNNKNYVIKNIGLNNGAIEGIYSAICAKYNIKKGQEKDQVQRDKILNQAIVAYINDLSNKALISGHEVERLFAGNPAFYKWKYDDDGNLIDRTVDELKRLGGMVSTGTNNFEGLVGLPDRYQKGVYVSAEVDNEMIESPQVEYMRPLVYTGQLRQTAYSMLCDEYIEKELEGFKKYKDETDIQASRRKYNLEQEARNKVDSQLERMSDEEIEKLLESKHKGIIAVIKKKAKSVIDSYRLSKDEKLDGIDIADGGAYITDEMCEALLRMVGSWSSDIEEAFKILRSGNIYTVRTKLNAYNKIVTTVIGTQKYTAFGRRRDPKTGIMITYYDKYALFPIFESIAYGRTANIFHAMKKQGVDQLKINSAIKVGSQGSQPIKWDDYSSVEGDEKPLFLDTFKFNSYEQRFKYLRKQLNTDPNEKKYMNIGTQATKIVMSNLNVNNYYVLRDGTKIKGQDLLDTIMNSMNRLSDIGMQNMMKQFFKTNEDGQIIDGDGKVIDDGNLSSVVIDQKKFIETVLDMIKSDDPNINLLSSLQVEGDEKSGYRLSMPIDAVQSSNFLESKLIAKINGEVIDTKTPGAAFIQRSVWGMQGSKLFERSDGGIVGDNNVTLYNGKRLQMINKEGSMDCVLSIDYFKKLLGDFDIQTKRTFELTKDGAKIPLKDKDGNIKVDKDGNTIYKTKIEKRQLSFEEARQWLIDNGIIGEEAKANILAYRIPTQAQSSIHALRCVDVIPVVNDTVILPEEFTKITGSDFDIDKLFLSGLNYKTEGVENIYGYVEQRLVKESELTEEHRLQNKIIDMYLALLIDKKDNGGPRNVQILHRSIDNDTELAKSVLKDIEGSGKSKTETPYSFYSLARQTASKNDYITGKVGIGPFALNNNNQILTMIYHISFRESQSSLLSTLGLSRLDKQLDVDGNSIMSWISAMINAHVDIAKDPWISRLNVNPFSYNITNLLLRTGWGGNTFYFLTQPIMKQMADAYVKASSQYMQQNGSMYSRQQQSIEDVAEQYFKKDVTFDGNTLEEALGIIESGDKDSIQAMNKAIKKLFESDQFKQDARDYAQGNDVVDQNALKSRQLGIYLAYVQFSKYANALANLVKYCKIDTKKHGKSAAEQLVYKEGFDELFEFATDNDGVLIKKGDVGALFEPAGLLDLVEHSYVGTKTRNAISLTKVVLGEQFMSSTTGFIQMLRQLNTMAGNTSLSVSFVQSAQKALSAAIKSEFFNDYASRISDNPRYMHDLVNSSTEDLEFSYDSSTNSMKITGNKHSLKSYVGQPILLWYKGWDGNLQQYVPRDKNGNAIPLKVLSAKDDKIQLNVSINGNFNGVCRLLGGANTIFDRLSRLKPMIYHNSDYADLKGNLLLEMLIPGKRVEYSSKDAVLGERPDTYDDLKFVKLQNFVDDGGINTNYIINAWNELLEYQNDKQPEVAEYIRNFARDLVVYAFITSGDTQGFAKMFKYVPASWRKKSGYANFINRKLEQLNSYIPTVDLNDVLLNNWYNNKLVPTYQFYSKDANGKRSSNFIGVAKMTHSNGSRQTLSAYPTMLAALKKNDEGIYVPSISVTDAPKFIKLPRSYNHYDSQRQYNVYQLYGFARYNGGIQYPVYTLVQPKGTKVSGGFMVTEYGRNDSTPSSTEYVVDQNALRNFVESADFINQLPVIKQNFGDEYAKILNDLRTEQVGGIAAAINDDYQAQHINTGNQPSTAQTATVVNPLTISDKTEAFGVTVDPKLKQNYKQWLVDHPNGIIAYRINYNNFNTAENVNKSIIGNPFDWQKYGQEKSLQMFYEWLTTGTNHGEVLATDEYRNAIINKLLSIDKPEVLYYKELGHPSHATVIGYLIEHKELLQPQPQTSTPISSEKSVTEQLVQHLKDSGFTVYGIDKNDIERNEDYQFAIERPNAISTETDDYEQRLQTILDEAPRDSKGRLLAPNGRPSNLPERLYAQVRTKEFKDWFGDWQNDPENASKVIDENGEPRIVYHGSDQYGFDIFDPSYSDDERSLFASGSKYIASTYIKHGPKDHSVVNRLVYNEQEMKPVLKYLKYIGADDFLKNFQYGLFQQAIEAVPNKDLLRSNGVDRRNIRNTVFDNPYNADVLLNGSALDEINRIENELKQYDPIKDQQIVDYLLWTLDIAKDSYYNSNVYYANVDGEDVVIRNRYTEAQFGEFEPSPIYSGSVADLYSLITGGGDIRNSNYTKYSDHIYDLFLNIRNPFVFENNNKSDVVQWNYIPINIGSSEHVTTRGIAEYAETNGYDGVILKHVHDNGGYPGDMSLYPNATKDDHYNGVPAWQLIESTDIFIAFKSNQIKSAGGENTTYSRTDDNIHFFKDSKGVVYGYVDNHGNIHFDKNKISPEHPIHEYTHIWDRVVALKNPSLWIRGVELMKQFNGGKLWNEIANSEFYGKKWSNMSDAQREFMIASEVHARLVGEGGVKLISEIEAKQGSSDIISKLKDWILKFWQSLKQTFSDWSYADIETLTLKDFNHMTLRDFVTSNADIINGIDARSSISDKIEMVGLVNYSSGIEVSEDAQRAIDKIKAISPNEQQYITPVITGETFIAGVSLVDAINIAANIKSIGRQSKVSDKIVREKISRILYSYDRKALFNLLSFGTVPNNILLMLADYMNYDDARGLVAHYIAFSLEQRCQKKSYYDVVIPIIKSIDVKYDDSREQSQFNDDIMKHCKGN